MIHRLIQSTKYSIHIDSRMSGIPLSSNWLLLQGKSKTASKLPIHVKKVQKVSHHHLENSSSSSASTERKLTTLEIFNRAANSDKKLSEATLGLQILSKKDEKIEKPISLIPEESQIVGKKAEPGKFLAIDCEFVGVGPNGSESALARVSIVNFYGHVILDKYVKPKEKVTDWRTWVSGVSPKHMKDAITFREAQQLCSDLFKDRVLVGHAIQNDLTALMLSHPVYLIRDTSKHLPFRQFAKGKTPGLKNLTKHYLKLDIQGAEHSSVEDARATMMLYRMHKKEFEVIQRKKFGNHTLKRSKSEAGKLQKK